VGLEGLPLNTYISMYTRTNRCYSERGSTTNHVRSSIPHCLLPPINLLYPELDGKRSGTPVLTERLVTEECWLRLVWTLKNYIHESISTLI